MLWTALAGMLAGVAVAGTRTVPVGDPLREMALELSDATSEALREERWAEALEALREIDSARLSKPSKADWSFLVAWAATHAGVPASAADVLPQLQGRRGTAPEAYVRVARAAIQQSTGHPEEALALVDGIDPSSPLYPTAALAAAEALHALDRPVDAWERVASVLERPDPVAGNAPLLLSLAEHHGAESAEAHPLLGRLWRHYPKEPEGERAAEILADSKQHQPTWEEVATRAQSLMGAEAYDEAIAETDGHVEHASARSEAGCRLRYTRGRSHYKRNRLRDAVRELAGLGEQCAGIDGNYGPRGLYLLGTAEYRRKEFASSAAAYRLLSKEYSSSSMADDAWTRGGISLLEGGEVEKAQAWWERALEEHPEGDTVPEAALRLAFAKYDAGDPGAAIAIAERLVALPIQGNATHIEAGRYWAARWRMYPRAEEPRTPTVDDAMRAEAVERWAALCRDVPHSFYSILAYSRLVEVAPDLAQNLRDRSGSVASRSSRTPWRVRVSTLENAHYRDAVALIRIGLVQEALTEWMRSDPSQWTPDEKAWSVELRVAAGDWLAAHDNFRRWVIANPLSTLGPREPQIVRLAWPDRYWSEVQNAVPDSYRYEPRLFHALVREESNFNREIVSFAGARGLSQLMWRTAQQTAGWLDVSVTKSQLFEPQANLNIGGRYLDAMHRQLADSPFLALAAYNGGARNVNSWVEEHQNPPLDEWVERVPFRETRGYIKRVMGTWQTMRYHFDDGPAFPDLSRFNHHAKP